MNRLVPTFLAILFMLVHTNCFADCNCDDWVGRSGYCVDYVKSRIPTFPIPMNFAEIENLKNKEVVDVAVGDVAIFDMGNYWHVAYVEKVHQDRFGTATSIDVSEMNYGRVLTFDKYFTRWRKNDKTEWERARRCGVTENYARPRLRNSIALHDVRQIWSPVAAESVKTAVSEQVTTVIHKVKDALTHLCVVLKEKYDLELQTFI